MPEWSTPDGQPADRPIHVYPLNDIREHILDGLWCPCMPRLVPADAVDGDGGLCQPDDSHAVIRHNSYDGREVREVVLRALDAMGKALADHDHCWSPSLRADYEQAVDMMNLHHRGQGNAN